jgi:hypothetical protein
MTKKKGQKDKTIQWSKEKDKGQTLTHNRHYNGQMKKAKDKQ